MKRIEQAKFIPFFGGLPTRLHIRSDLHLMRKTWHMTMGIIIVLCYLAGVSPTTGVIILGSFLGLDLALENARLRSSSLNDRILKFWAPLMRAHEIRQMSTVPHYLASVILAIAIFPKPVAILSILYLACGDPIASIFGILYGYKGPRFANGKTLIGTLAGVFACSILTFAYLNTFVYSESSLIALTLLGGLAGGMAELLPFDIDDNFTIPVISGFVLWLGFMVTGI
jgi:dolichol kinase